MTDKPKFVFPEFHVSFNSSQPLKDLIPGMCGEHHLVILSGEAYAGKTRLALQMAHYLAKGLPFFWQDPLPPQQVLYFTERSNASVMRDAQDRGLDMGGIRVVSIIELDEAEYAEYETNRFKWLKGVIKRYKPTVVILDTFGHFVPTYAAGRGGMNDYATMGRATRELQRLCLREKVTMFLIHHYAKEKEGSGYKSFKQKSSGTTSIAGNTMSMWGLEATGPIDDCSGHSDYVVLSCLYHHAPPPQPIYLKSAENGVFQIVSHDDVVKAMMPSKVDTRKQQVLGLFPDDKTPVSRKRLVEEIVTKLKISKAQAYHIIVDLINEGLLVVENTIDDDIQLRKATAH